MKKITHIIVITFFLVTLQKSELKAQEYNSPEYEEPNLSDEEGNDGKWTFWGNSNITTNQSQFSNWQGGGQNAISVATSLSLNLLYQNATTTWQTTLDAGYGLMLQGKNGIWYKNDDRIFLATQLGKKASENWNYSLYFSPQTQFQPGYYSEFDTMPISDFFAPGYVVASFGFEYKPDNKLSVFLGPLSSKNTFVLNQDLANMGAYGVEPGVYDYVEGKYIKEGKKIRSETGGFIRVSFYEPRVMKNISLDSRLELFANYLYKRGNIDVNFENQINLKVNEYISTNLILHLIYDDDILIALDDSFTRFGPRLQFKEVLSVGLTIDLGGNNNYYY
ncbi:MAG: DUF3078 domain-containing protein [Bacteroidia bacterium]